MKSSSRAFFCNSTGITAASASVEQYNRTDWYSDTLQPGQALVVVGCLDQERNLPQASLLEPSCTSVPRSHWLVRTLELYRYTQVATAQLTILAVVAEQRLEDDSHGSAATLGS